MIHPIESIYKFPVLSQSQAREDLDKRVKLLQIMADNPLIDKINHPLVRKRRKMEKKMRIHSQSAESLQYLFFSM
jgi:hypothetical protein